MLVRIDITQEDIEAGVRNSCRACPGARAINRSLADEHFCEVNGGDEGIEVRKADGTKWGDYVTNVVCPKSLNAFISNFDKGNCVLPSSFELDIPEDLLRSNV